MNSQSGSITLVFASVLAVLLGFLALAIDLSRLYLARSTLQGAADAAALAGARELDGTVAGSVNAVFVAQQVLQRYRLTLENNTAPDPALATFRLGPCPNPDSGSSALAGSLVSAPHWSGQSPSCTFVGATANAATTGVTDGTGLRFLEVDSGTQAGLTPYFAQVLALLGAAPAVLTPYGYAVGGKVSSTGTLLYR
ncbi:MAG: hypothetical protein KGI47_01730 [Betaproteobacteria bacterium]|nr:hypothetical protein [Betaproteobacteria bacterium]MDE2623116.1 hypothetical protein [Betaproteobacteria bacterium]